VARAESRIAFERLLAGVVDFTLVDASTLSYTESFVVRGLNDLPVRFRAADRVGASPRCRIDARRRAG
jgi:hypothetical protein